MKWGSQLTAEYFEIYSSDIHLEPIALLEVSGRGFSDGGPGAASVRGAGAGHATQGGTGKLNCSPISSIGVCHLEGNRNVLI